MVPWVASTVPDLSNWTGPTRLGLLAEGGGPKYERLMLAPTEGGAGNKLQPGPGPIGPGPGPWAVLGSPSAGPSLISAAILPSTDRSHALPCVRKRADSSARPAPPTRTT